MTPDAARAATTRRATRRARRARARSTACAARCATRVAGRRGAPSRRAARADELFDWFESAAPLALGDARHAASAPARSTSSAWTRARAARARGRWLDCLCERYWRVEVAGPRARCPTDGPVLLRREPLRASCPTTGCARARGRARARARRPRFLVADWLMTLPFVQPWLARARRRARVPRERRAPARSGPLGDRVSRKA